MKKFFAVFCIVMVVLISFSSCSKEEDNSTSDTSNGDTVVTSDNIKGTWTVTSLYSEIERRANNVTTKMVTTVENENWRQVISLPETDSVRILNGKITKEPNQNEGAYFFYFGEDGKARLTYKYEYDEDLTEEDDEFSVIHQVKYTREWVGTWIFLAATGNYGDRLAFVIEELKETEYEYEIIGNEEGESSLPRLISTNVVNDRYANGQMGTFYILVEHNANKIKMHQDIDRFYLRTENGTAQSYQDVGYEEMTLRPRM